MISGLLVLTINHKSTKPHRRDSATDFHSDLHRLLGEK